MWSPFTSYNMINKCKPYRVLEREGVIVNSCKEDRNLPLNTPSLAQWKKKRHWAAAQHSYGSVERRGSRDPSFNYSKHAWPVPFFVNFYVSRYRYPHHRICIIQWEFISFHKEFISFHKHVGLRGWSCQHDLVISHTLFPHLMSNFSR